MAQVSTLTAIAWERIHLHLTVQMSQSEAVSVSRHRPDEDALSEEEQGAEQFGLSPLEEEAEVEDEQPDAELVPESPATGEVVFHLVDGRRAFPTRTTPLGDDRYDVHLNVVDFRERKQVPDGTWRLVPFVDGVAADPTLMDLGYAQTLEAHSRVFLYDRNMVGYNVSFAISEDEYAPEFIVRTYQMFRKGARKRLLSNPAGRIKARLRREATTAANRWYSLARRLDPPGGTRILFASEMRTSLGGNLLAIRDRMVERGLDKQYEFRYSFRIPSTADKKGTLELIRLLATSDYVLIDDYFGILESLKIDKSTRLIQVWHAGSGFKSIGLSRFGRYGSPRLQNAHRTYTYAIAGSRHLAHVYAEAFGIEESAVIPTGLPRIDAFLDEERTARVRTDFDAAYPHLVGRRRILFAPTFRGRGATDAYYDYARIDFDALYEVCGHDSVVLFRMHHFVPDAVPIPEAYRDRLFDLSAFPDANDLLLSTDILITDYSSIIYEFSLLRRPMLFYAFDKGPYSITRGFHRDYDETAPGKVVESFDELVEAIRSGDFETHKIDRFLEENFDAIDTHSSDRFIDWLILGSPPTQDASASHGKAHP